MNKKRKNPTEMEIIKSSVLLGVTEEDLLLALEMLDALKEKLDNWENQSQQKNDHKKTKRS
jgi:hypothetical protein